MAEEIKKDQGKKKDKKDKKKKAFGSKLAGAFAGLYDDKKDNREWFEGKEILYRKWTKKMDIEYDSDPENKKKDGKSHKHTAELFSVQYDKNSILTKDKDTGGYCTYAVNSIKIKLPPRTTENYKEPPIKPNTTQYDTFGYTRNKYRKKRNDAPDIPNDLKGFKRIDHGLRLYYEMMGRTDYKNDNGIGKFMEYVEENDLQEDEIDEEFNGEAENCTYTDFDDNFPFKKETKDNNKDEKDDNKDNMKTESDNIQDPGKKIFDILKYCYKYAFPENHPDYEPW
eukprot:85773_1